MSNNTLTTTVQNLPLVESTDLGDYLERLGLPSKSIIAEISARKVIGSNLPVFIQNLSPEIKKDARY